MTDKLSIEKDAIRALADILVETDLTEIEYENEGHRIRVARNLNVSASVPLPSINVMQPTAPAAVAYNPTSNSASLQSAEGALKSPMVGTVYAAAEPGAAPYVKVGDTVTQGQTLLIIEAMKVMNPIKAPRAGKITSIFVADAQPVEFGEPLLVIE